MSKMELYELLDCSKDKIDFLTSAFASAKDGDLPHGGAFYVLHDLGEQIKAARDAAKEAFEKGGS